jgi:hypothetical protein
LQETIGSLTTSATDFAFQFTSVDNVQGRCLTVGGRAMPRAGSEQVLTMSGICNDCATTHVLFRQGLAAEIGADRVRSISDTIDTRYCRTWRYVQEQEKILRVLPLPAAIPSDFRANKHAERGQEPAGFGTETAPDGRVLAWVETAGFGRIANGTNPEAAFPHAGSTSSPPPFDSRSARRRWCRGCRPRTSRDRDRP